MTSQEPSGARGILHGVLWFVLANLVLVVANAWGYLGSAPDSTALGWIFLRVALVAQVTSVGLILGLILAGLAALAGPARAPNVIAPIASLLFVGLQLFLLVDRKQYALFRFHLNGLALDVIRSPAGWESMHVSHRDLAIVVGGIVLALVLEALAFRFLLRRFAGESAPVLKRWAWLVAPIALMAIGERATYAWADLKNVREVTRAARVVPLYQPFTVKRVAKKYFGVQVESDVRVASVKGGLLAYPKKPLTFRAPEKKPNIVWLTLDSWRADEMSAARTPNIAAFANGATVFESHLSGGNATRYGVFSMYYGIHSSYWQTMLSERRGPVLVSRLKELGYQTKILSSTSLTWPEFRRTAFVEIAGTVEDEMPGARTKDKDRQLTERFDAFLEARGTNETAPFFAWLFFDSSHSPYDFDETAKLPWPDYEKTVSQTSLDSLRTDEAARTRMRHRYENAVAYLDGLCQHVFDTLEKRGLGGDTIVLITGDHGEEYYEHGFFGHNGAFTPEQIHVPLVLKIPGRAPEHVARVTSHEDLVPTFMEILGVENPPGDYSLGRSLFATEPARRTVACSWSECALIDSSGWLVFGTETWASAGVEVLGPDYKEVPDRRAVLREKGADLAGVAQDMSAFLR